jgi:hypothetical protein
MSAAAPVKAKVAPKKKEKKGAKRQPQINVPGGSSIAETQVIFFFFFFSLFAWHFFFFWLRKATQANLNGNRKYLFSIK